MLVTSFSVLLPVFFVMGLGYWAGRAKRFDAHQMRGINDVVMTYALPSLMFVATGTTTRSAIFSEVPFLLALLIALLGFYIAVALLSVLVLRHSIGAAGLQAFLITYPSVAFFGIPIFKGLFGGASLVSIASASILASITIAPLTVVLLEIHAQHSATSEVGRVGALIWNGLVNSFAKPMVWAPLLGLVFVLLNIHPKEIDSMLLLIGSTTSGTSLFLGGLIISSYSITTNSDILFNMQRIRRALAGRERSQAKVADCPDCHASPELAGAWLLASWSWNRDCTSPNPSGFPDLVHGPTRCGRPARGARSSRRHSLSKPR
jgi:malonate transporter